MEPEFKKVLPEQIPVEKFARVCTTAFQNNPDILKKCDEQSIWNACMKAAADGLLPDGRDGAIVPYKGLARWMIMIGGLRKLVRNSGDISTWETAIVCQNDLFHYRLGDDPRIEHEPALRDRGPIIAAYSIAKLKDGSISREVMSIEDIEGIRSKSTSEKGPWNDPIFYPEMVRKTVARRHSKVLPLSTDLDDVIRREDDMYDLDAQPVSIQQRKPASLTDKLDQLAITTAPKDEAAAGEVIEGTATQTQPAGAGATNGKPSNGLLTKEQLIASLNGPESKLGYLQLWDGHKPSLAALSKKDLAEVDAAFQEAFEKAAD